MTCLTLNEGAKMRGLIAMLAAAVENKIDKTRKANIRKFFIVQKLFIAELMAGSVVWSMSDFMAGSLVEFIGLIDGTLDCWLDGCFWG